MGSTSAISVAGPRPIVVVGKEEKVAKIVSAKLMPEYQVVKFFSNLNSVLEELPSILAPTQSTNSEDPTAAYPAPKHIQFDIVYTPEQVQQVREACGGADAKVSWYWAPMPEGLNLPPIDTFDHAQLNMMTDFVAAKLKGAMNNVVEAGREGEDGVYQM